MSQDRTKNTIRNMAAGFGARFVHLLMPFISRTVIVDILGKEYLGLNTLFTSIFMFLNLAEFGFSSALTYKMYKPASENNYKLMSVYASAIRKVYKVLGLIMLLLGVMVIPFITNFIKGEYPSGINIYLLYLLFLINMVIPYLGCGYCTSIFASYQRVDLTNKINAGITFVLNISQIIILYLGRDYYLYVLCMPILTVASSIILSKVRKKYYPEIDVNINIDNRLLKETFSTAGALFGHSLNYVVVSAADNIVISSCLGLSILAIYGNYYTILSAVIGLIDIVIQSCLPSIGNLLLENNKEHEIRLFKTLSFISYWLSGWCGICLICLYQTFMEIWMGDDMLLPFSTVVLFAVYLYSFKARAAIILFKDACGMWKADFWKPYISAMANIIINISLVQIIGLNGVLISTIIVFVLINFPWESKILINARFEGFEKQYYIQFVLFAVVNVGLAFITVSGCKMISINNEFIRLIVNGCICIFLPNFLWWILFRNKDEYKYVVNRFVSVVRK